MNKDQLLSLVNQLNLPKGEYSICSTGSLVIRGILEKAGDLDLQVTKECFNYIKNTFKITFKTNLEVFFEKDKYNPLYKFDELDIEFFVMDKKDILFDYVDGYPCQDVDEILNFKKQRNLDKDKIAIEKILQYKKSK